jgi:hypothetical protein
MDYIPGDIHENLQKEHFFLINQDFVWLNCGPKRLSEMSNSKGSFKMGTPENETKSINLSKGDIISVRFFKNSSTSYTYLERVIYNNGDVIDYKTESIISLTLIENNLDPGEVQNKSWLFTDVTKEFERDKKIEIILC